MRDDMDDVASELIDVTGLSLADLDSAGESSLAHALRRIVGSEQDDAEVIAGFSSRI